VCINFLEAPDFYKQDKVKNLFQRLELNWVHKLNRKEDYIDGYDKLEKMQQQV